MKAEIRARFLRLLVLPLQCGKLNWIRSGDTGADAGVGIEHASSRSWSQLLFSLSIASTFASEFALAMVVDGK